MLIGVVKVFYFSAFLLLWLKDFAWQGLLLAVAVPVMIHLGTAFLPRLFPADKLLLSLVNFLCALGVLVLYATNPAYAYQQALYYGVGLVCMVVCIYLVRLIRSWGIPAALLMPVSLALLALPLVIGDWHDGAKNWITPAHELETYFFPQASWILDAINEKIVPLPGYTPVTNQTVEEQIRIEKDAE